MAEDEVEKESGGMKPQEKPEKPPISGWDSAFKGINSTLYGCIV